MRKVAKSTSHVASQTLPPTAAAAEYHNLRVYYQINRLERDDQGHVTRRVGMAHR